MSFDFALVNNDLKIQADGSVAVVKDSSKLRQDVVKIILTQLGSNRFHPWYGCSVSDDVIGSELPANMMNVDIRSSVTQSLDRLKTLQLQQLTSQKVSLAELIHIIGDVVAYRSLEDPRHMKLQATVYSKRLTEISEEFTLS
jgi:phage baseplate assembly protein W